MRRFLLLIVCVLFSPLPVWAGEVRVLAAASLADALRAVALQYEQRHPGTTIVTSFGASGALARQIIAGAPADLFISASPQWIAELAGQGLIDGAGSRVLAGNDLVFVAAPDSAVAGMADLARLHRIAIGSPASTPAGQYARQALRHAGLYETLGTGGRLVLAKDVRQALVYAERGEVDGAFVYHTDARLAERVVVRFMVPADSYDRVTYPMALTSAGTANPEAHAFYAFLQSPPTQAILAGFGFRTSP